MSTGAKEVDEAIEVTKYHVQYPASAYTFPSDARIHQVRLDHEFISIELMDGRVLAIPLRWVPTLYHAAPEDRARYEINSGRTMLIWDPAKCAINDELRVADYLGQSV
jgi:hypothetical protein